MEMELTFLYNCKYEPTKQRMCARPDVPCEFVPPDEPCEFVRPDVPCECARPDVPCECVRALMYHIGDYVMPYKISHHPVCSYTGRDRKRVTLSECEGYPDPTIEVFDASGCECKSCDSDYTSCENLNG
ncbi:hypothetical protein Btru_032594 [Bulinus truncatus]|nr:hypothetical protein Btru_032594 [Bulinus truncatus]